MNKLLIFPSQIRHGFKKTNTMNYLFHSSLCHLFTSEQSIKLEDRIEFV